MSAIDCDQVSATVRPPAIKPSRSASSARALPLLVASAAAGVGATSRLSPSPGTPLICSVNPLAPTTGSPVRQGVLRPVIDEVYS